MSPTKTGSRIALLRGINVSGRNTIPMADLRELAGELGWKRPRTYIQSGNLVFEGKGKASELEAALEAGIAKRFELTIPVLVRDAKQWAAYVKSNPYALASETQAHLVLLGLSKKPPLADAVERLRERVASGELIEQAGDALWFYYPNGVASSRLSPALIDRLAGSSVTARNWRTVLELERMVEGGD